jgi:aldehyde:ferredoxin oxidoreductase
MTIVGHILEVNLSAATVSTSPLPLETIHLYTGGRGFNVGYLYEHLEAGTDPLGPDNILLISGGLLTGTPAPTSSRMHVSSLSPQTGLIGSSNVGGHLGARLRGFGIQVIIVKGRSRHPVFLYIHKGGIEIRDARPLWGLGTVDTQIELEKSLNDPRIKSIAIGPAGENRVPFACLITDGDHAAGRTGMGAVMGSKHLKAVVVGRSPKASKPAISKSTRKAMEHYVGLIKSSPEYPIFTEFGGAGYVTWADDMGVMPTRNYRDTRFEGIEQLDGRRLKAHRVRSRGCFRCPIQCKAELKIKAGKHAGERLNRPEFESLMILGAKCGLDDAEEVTYLDNLCSCLGLDCLSAGSVIAFAMDLFDRGVITVADTDGLELEWGDAKVMETLLRKIAHREGFGDVLARGVKQAADIIAGGAADLAPHVKGLELTAYHPENLLGTALGYMISSRGGDYIYASMEHRWSPERAQAEFGSPAAVDMHSPEAKGPVVRRAVLVNIALDSLGLCRVPSLTCIGEFDLVQEAKLASAVMGLAITPEKLFAAAERVAVLERLFNLRHGVSPESDALPAMFFKSGQGKLTPDVMNQMLQEFYQVMGWDDTGRPTREKLLELDIEAPGAEFYT